MQRTSGILLHPTALPGALSCGDLGQQARQFVDFLARAGQGLWQVLPIGPTGPGHSPYNALSAFAGNPVLIDLQQLAIHGDLDRDMLCRAHMRCEKAGFDQVHSLKKNLLEAAGRRFFSKPATARHREYQSFCDKHADWLDDFSLFMALRQNFSGQVWSSWPEALRHRDSTIMEEWRGKLAESCRLFQYQQFVFTEQWHELKSYANRNGIRIFGDLPIFVAYDSADVWANQHLFRLDDQGRPIVVAGVPPDYFSETGQRWGNPLYHWERLVAEDFLWWLRRFEHQWQYSDMIRIDHFRGFQACWSIPASEPTAVNGRWEEVPGRALFEKLCGQRKELPIVAEDLGLITPEVEKLRDDFGFPGMKILQFAFDSGPDNPYLPENHVINSVVYTGTHDNDTTLGWWRRLAAGQRQRIRDYLGIPHPEMPWDLIRLAMSSISELCVIPCQDILALGSRARFNTPGRASGNWTWQMSQGVLSDELAERLRVLSAQYHRTVEL
jgi:4-alpha-glucanotransferase